MGRPSLRRFLLLECLENRRLLAHNIGHNPGGGNPNLGAEDCIVLTGDALTITGGKRSDRISIDVEGTTMTVKCNKQTEVIDLSTMTVGSITVDGGTGNDRITIDEEVTTGMTIDGGRGNDRITGGGGVDDINGEEGNDWLWGGGEGDMMDGGPGNDKLFGQDGEDELLGGDKNDFLDGGEDNDTLDGGDGHDRIHGRAGDDLIFGGANKDLLYGEEGNDTIDGGDDKDHLLGGDGDDILLGGAGNDQLNGGPGNNQLDGGEGTDKEVNGTPLTALSAMLTSATDMDAMGTATFAFTLAEGASEFELNITVTGYTASSMLDVSVGGTVIGQITLDINGDGTFTASTNPTDATEAEIPDTLTIEAGTVVLISTDLTGTLAVV